MYLGSVVLFLVVYLTPGIAGQDEGCGNEIQVPLVSSKVYGTANTFYSIARGIIEGTQGNLNDKRLKTSYDFLMGSSSYNDAVTALTQQPGYFVMEGISVVIFLVGAIALIVVIVYRCCCGCRDKHQHPLIFSRAPLFIVSFFLIVCLAFIVTSMVLFIQSTNFSFNEIHRADKQVIRAKEDVSYTRIIGTNQVNCSKQITVDVNFPLAVGVANSLPDSVINTFYVQTGLTQVQNYYWSGTINEAQTGEWDIQFINMDLDRYLKEKKLSGAQYQNELNNELTLMLQLNTSLDQLQQATIAAYAQFNATLVASQQNTQKTRASMAIATSATSTSILSQQMAIGASTMSIPSSVESLLSMTNTLANTIGLGRDTAQNWGGLSGIRVGALICVIVPCILSILFIIIVSLASCFKGIMNQQAPDNIIGMIALTGFYVTVIFSAGLILVTNALFWFSYPYAGVCTRFFEDSSFTAFDRLNLPPISIMGADGNNYSTPFSTIFRSCQSSTPTVYSVMGHGEDILFNLDTLHTALNLPTRLAAVQSAIKQGNWAFTIDQTSINNLNNSLATFSGLVQQLVAQNSSGFLPLTNAVEPAAASTVSQLQGLTGSLLILQTNTTQLLNLLNIASKSASQPPNTQVPMMSGMADNSYNYITNMTDNAVTRLMDQLKGSSFKCQAIYNAFRNTGNIPCDQFSRPVYGMWASAGLASIFFLPTAFLLLYASKLFFPQQKRVRFSEEAEVTIQAVQPVPSIYPQLPTTPPADSNYMTKQYF